MRALIGVTCVAILAAVGYFFWSEYQKHLRAEAYQQAAAERAAFNAERAVCLPKVRQHMQARTYKELLPAEQINPCLRYFTQAEIDAWKAAAN